MFPPYNSPVSWISRLLLPAHSCVYSYSIDTNVCVCVCSLYNIYYSLFILKFNMFNVKKAFVPSVNS